MLLVHHPEYMMGQKLCKEAGYTDEEMAVIIDDIRRKHSCRGEKKPGSQEGKIMAVADSMFH